MERQYVGDPIDAAWQTAPWNEDADVASDPVDETDVKKNADHDGSITMKTTTQIKSTAAEVPDNPTEEIELSQFKKRQRQALKMIFNDPDIGVSVIADRLDVVDQSVHNYLNHLHRSGVDKQAADKVLAWLFANRLSRSSIRNRLGGSGIEDKFKPLILAREDLDYDPEDLGLDAETTQQDIGELIANSDELSGTNKSVNGNAESVIPEQDLDEPEPDLDEMPVEIDFTRLTDSQEAVYKAAFTDPEQSMDEIADTAEVSPPYVRGLLASTKDVENLTQDEREQIIEWYYREMATDLAIKSSAVYKITDLPDAAAAVARERASEIPDCSIPDSGETESPDDDGDSTTGESAIDTSESQPEPSQTQQDNSVEDTTETGDSGAADEDETPRVNGRRTPLQKRGESDDDEGRFDMLHKVLGGVVFILIAYLFGRRSQN